MGAKYAPVYPSNSRDAHCIPSTYACILATLLMLALTVVGHKSPKEGDYMYAPNQWGGNLINNDNTMTLLMTCLWTHY